MKNEYIPYPAIIEEIRREAFDTKTFRLRFKDKKIAEAFTYKQGQFMEVSVLGAGEAPISITSSPSRPGFLEFTIRAAGMVTKAIHGLNTGDCVYLRGPYGNAFPFEEIKGKIFISLLGVLDWRPYAALLIWYLITGKILNI